MVIDEKNKMYLAVLLALLLAFGIEVFIFNGQYFATKKETAIEVPLEYCSYQGLVERYDDGSILLESGEDGAYVQFSVKDSGIKIKNIALSVSTVNGDESWWGYLRKPYAVISSTSVEAAVLVSRGEGNVVLRDRILYGREGEWDIINLPDVTDAAEITLQLKGLKGSTLLLSGISLNTRVPISILPLRVFAVFLFLAFVYMLRPGSMLWTDRLLEENGLLENTRIGFAITEYEEFDYNVLAEFPETEKHRTEVLVRYK